MQQAIVPSPARARQNQRARWSSVRRIRPLDENIRSLPPSLDECFHYRVQIECVRGRALPIPSLAQSIPDTLIMSTNLSHIFLVTRSTCPKPWRAEHEPWIPSHGSHFRCRAREDLLCGRKDQHRREESAIYSTRRSYNRSAHNRLLLFPSMDTGTTVSWESTESFAH